MLLELFGRDRRETPEQVLDGDLRVLLLAARGEQEGEERLQHGEPLRCDGTRRPLARLDGDAALGRITCRLRRLALVALAYAAQRRRDLAAQLLGLERHGAPVLAEHP